VKTTWPQTWWPLHTHDYPSWSPPQVALPAAEAAGEAAAEEDVVEDLAKADEEAFHPQMFATKTSAMLLATSTAPPSSRLIM
jgi:hypothetical protein